VASSLGSVDERKTAARYPVAGESMPRLTLARVSVERTSPALIPFILRNIVALLFNTDSLPFSLWLSSILRQ
jgi:hypothetical protein